MKYFVLQFCVVLSCIAQAQSAVTKESYQQYLKDQEQNCLKSSYTIKGAVTDIKFPGHQPVNSFAESTFSIGNYEFKRLPGANNYTSPAQFKFQVVKRESNGKLTDVSEAFNSRVLNIQLPDGKGKIFVMPPIQVPQAAVEIYDSKSTYDSGKPAQQKVTFGGNGIVFSQKDRQDFTVEYKDKTTFKDFKGLGKLPTLNPVTKSVVNPKDSKISETCGLPAKIKSGRESKVDTERTGT